MFLFQVSPQAMFAQLLSNIKQNPLYSVCAFVYENIKFLVHISTPCHVPYQSGRIQYIVLQTRHDKCRAENITAYVVK